MSEKSGGALVSAWSSDCLRGPPLHRRDGVTLVLTSSGNAALNANHDSLSSRAAQAIFPRRKRTRGTGSSAINSEKRESSSGSQDSISSARVQDALSELAQRAVTADERRFCWACLVIRTNRTVWLGSQYPAAEKAFQLRFFAASNRLDQPGC